MTFRVSTSRLDGILPVVVSDDSDRHSILSLRRPPPYLDTRTVKWVRVSDDYARAFQTMEAEAAVEALNRNPPEAWLDYPDEDIIVFLSGDTCDAAPRFRAPLAGAKPASLVVLLARDWELSLGADEQDLSTAIRQYSGYRIGLRDLGGNMETSLKVLPSTLRGMTRTTLAAVARDYPEAFERLSINLFRESRTLDEFVAEDVAWHPLNLYPDRTQASLPSSMAP